jgi:hypothetical protein
MRSRAQFLRRSVRGIGPYISERVLVGELEGRRDRVPKRVLVCILVGMLGHDVSVGIRVETIVAV